MAGQIRFYTDENVSRAVIDGLRRLDVDVVSAPDAGMLGKSDEEHLALARRLERVIFTHDRDFLRLNRRGIPHAGIVFAREGTSISRLIRGLRRVYETKTPEDMIGHLEYI